MRKLAEARAKGVRVGVLSSKGGGEEHTDDDGKPSGVSMVELAAIHEFGSRKAGIPERSFIRRTFNSKRKQLAAMQVKLARAIVLRKLPVKSAYEILGQWAAAEVKKTITQTKIPPPLKKETIRRKKSDRPLVNTGKLLNAITHEVTNVTS